MNRYEYLRALEAALAELRKVVTEQRDEKVNVLKANRLFGTLVEEKTHAQATD